MGPGIMSLVWLWLFRICGAVYPGTVCVGPCEDQAPRRAGRGKGVASVPLPSLQLS